MNDERTALTAVGQRLPGTAILVVFFAAGLAFGACGVFGNARERCEDKCEDDEAIYDPDDDTCFCRSRR